MEGQGLITTTKCVTEENKQTKKLKSVIRLNSANKIDNDNRGWKQKKKKKQSKSIYRASENVRIMNVFLESMLRAISLAGNHSSPHLPRMPSDTVLISGPVVAAAQILSWSYCVFLHVLVWICVFFPPMSTAIRTSAFSFVGTFNVFLYIP